MFSALACDGEMTNHMKVEDMPLALQVSGSHRDMTRFCRGECPTTTLPPFDYLRLSSRQPDIPLITKETIVIPWIRSLLFQLIMADPVGVMLVTTIFQLQSLIMEIGGWCEQLNYSWQCNLLLKLYLDRINSLEY